MRARRTPPAAPCPPVGAVWVPAIASASALVGLAASVALRKRAAKQALGPQAPIVIVPKDRDPVHPIPPS